jgi:hypothetical protein
MLAPAIATSGLSASSTSRAIVVGSTIASPLTSAR